MDHRTPRIHTKCDQCPLHTVHPTRTKAYASMTAHELETGHDRQSVSEPNNGAWVAFRPLNPYAPNLRLE